MPRHPQTTPAAAGRWKVAVLAFDGISPFHLSVPGLVFGEDRRAQGMPAVDFRVCAVRPGRIRTSAGFAIEVRHGLRTFAAADLLIVPSWSDPARRPPDALLGTLGEAHRRGAHVVGLCLGAFVLAHAGLLDGHRATTHWNWADALATRFPGVDVDADVLYADASERITTSAGTAAAIDCCLHLVARRCGAAVAGRVARRLVVSTHRDGGQAQFIERPVADSSQDRRMAQALQWLQSSLAQVHTIDALAARLAMSRRTLTRRFRAATGTTLVRWLVAQRLEQARTLLETTGRDIESIAQACGFGSAVSMRQHFQRAFATSPTRYRRQFGGDVGAGSAIRVGHRRAA